MRIATNVSALNAWRNLSITQNALGKTLEKLSSGYRINRAADDAAGLAISEKMRGQIAGINMAVKNAQDGISLIQTGEGALNEVHAMLKRMEELAVQAANDTNTAEDRAKLQAEMDQLAQEVARIGSTTEFNTLKLLDGTFANKDIVFHVGANENQNLRIRIGDMRSFALGLAGEVRVEITGTFQGANNVINDGTYTVRGDATSGYELVDSAGNVVATSNDGEEWTAVSGDETLIFDEAITSGTVTVETVDTDGNTSRIATGVVRVANQGLEAGVYTVKETSSGSQFQLVDQNEIVIATSEDGTAWVSAADGTTVFSTTTALTDGAQVSVGGIDISSSQSAANSALPKIRAALEKVSEQRSLFGATQNRLEHTINNLQVAAENLSAAESRIRDVDMAAEMANFTRNQILLQAGTAMLAQANIAPQSVLQLLG